MNWKLLPETRCKYIHVRSDAASMRHTVSGNSFQSMPSEVNGTAVIERIRSFVQSSQFIYGTQVKNLMTAVSDVRSDEYWPEDEPAFQVDDGHHVSVFFLSDKGNEHKHFAHKSPAALTG